MSVENISKKLERRAKSLLLSKDIPSAKMEVVKSLLKNKNLLPEERYHAVIEIVKNCTDKPVNLPEDSVKNNSAVPADVTVYSPEPEEKNSGPLETSFFVESIAKKYKPLKIFKKRYLVHRNNRFGVGFRKRLVPTKRLLGILEDISKAQGLILGRFNDIMVAILKNEEIEDAAVFNYLRLIRKWLMISPLSRHDFYSVKWMERQNFDREFKPFINNFFSFLKLNVETRENIILIVEDTLRSLEDLKKFEISGRDPEQVKRDKEKKNLEREKQIYEYMMMLRSFLPNTVRDDTVLSKRLNNKHHISTLPDFLFILSEALIFQKTIGLNEINIYYNTEPPVVSSEKWDYSEDVLKKFGKDPESRKKRQISILKERLAEFDTINSMLNTEYKGYNIMMKSVDDQWRIADNRRMDSYAVYKDNFFTFLDALINYIKNACVPILNGASIQFVDNKKNQFEGSIFTFTYMEEELGNLLSINNEMHFFRTNNPTLAVSLSEVKKIMRGQINSMADVKHFVTALGDFLYKTGKKMQKVYDLHRLWEINGRQLEEKNLLRKPLDFMLIDNDEYKTGRPLPFFDCTISGFQNSTPLSKLFSGKMIYDSASAEGVFVYMIALFYQGAYACMNRHLMNDLSVRKNILKDIENISRKK